MTDLTFEQALAQAQARFQETLITLKQLATDIERWGRSLSDAQAAALFLIYPLKTVKWLIGKERYYLLYARYRRVYRLPKQRSSRRLAVQAKRAAMGLNIWGLRRDLTHIWEPLPHNHKRRGRARRLTRKWWYQKLAGTSRSC